jgi:hypothetical protein
MDLSLAASEAVKRLGKASISLLTSRDDLEEPTDEQPMAGEDLDRRISVHTAMALSGDRGCPPDGTGEVEGSILVCVSFLTFRSE